jgi:hypothetical protein
MILNKESDIEFFVNLLTRKEMCLEPNHFYEFHMLNSPIESLNGQSIPDYLGISPNILAKLELMKPMTKIEDASLISHMIDSFDEKDRESKIEMIKQALPEHFIMEYDDISDDLFFNNPIVRCFDDI